jgi:hypothetical protein
MKKNLIGLFICCLLAQKVLAYELTGAENAERLELTKAINHRSLALTDTTMQQMLTEANFAANRLKLPTHYPIVVPDICNHFIVMDWLNVLHTTNQLIDPRFPDTIYGAHIFDATIPRASRLHALKFGLFGYIANTNFQFGFAQGRLIHIERLSDPSTEYYAHDLNKLVGQPSLIDTNGAYQLATQWLAAVDVDMTRLEKLKWTVNQLHYRSRGATNSVTLPLYYIDFGGKHYPASGNLVASDEPLLTVEVLGTTKQLQELRINDVSFCQRPLLIITNAFDLIETPSKSMQSQENN